MKNNMQPEVRFSEYVGDWEQRKLRQLVERVVRKNKDLKSTLPLTISAQNGLVDQNTFFNKQVASRDVSGYYLIYNGEFAYNKSYSNGFPLGAVKRLDKYDMGVISTLYIAFNPINVVSDFLVSYYDTNYWHKEVSKNAAEGARNHGLLNISASDFFETKLSIPNQIDEQQKIGIFFKQLDDTIALQQRQLERLKDSKQGFLEKMFPKDGERVPEIRFAGFSEVWRNYKLAEISNSFSGGTPSAGNSKYYGGDIPFIRSGEINESFTKLFITEQGLNNSSAKMICKGDILYALYGATSGEVGISKIHGAINQAILAIKPLNNYDGYLITQCLRMKKDLIISTYLQGGQGNLSGGIVKNLIISLPDSQLEQQKIGAFFKQLDDNIALHEKELDLLKETKKAFLQKMFV